LLTADLAIVAYERAGRLLRAVPDRLSRERHSHYPDLAERMLAIYRQGAGETRRTLHARVEALFADEEACDPRRIRAFCKLLDDVSVYETDPRGRAAKLRLDVFARAAVCHPLVEEKRFVFDQPVAEVRGRIAAELGMPWPEIEAALYRDVMDQQPLRSFAGYATAADLLARYNVAQVQAAPYRAEALTLRVAADFKVILRQAKLAGLLHEIQRIDAETYRLDLAGPASVLHETRRYGVAMACFFPSLLACRGWTMQARLKAPWSAPAILDLADTDGLRSAAAPPPAFDSGVEERFAEKFGTVRAGWTLRREGAILHEGQSVFLPDFTLRHEDGTEVHLEIVGFWTPEYLAKKRETVRRFRQQRSGFSPVPALLVLLEIIQYQQIVIFLKNRSAQLRQDIRHLFTGTQYLQTGLLASQDKGFFQGGMQRHGIKPAMHHDQAVFGGLGETFANLPGQAAFP